MNSTNSKTHCVCEPFKHTRMLLVGIKVTSKSVWGSENIMKPLYFQFEHATHLIHSLRRKGTNWRVELQWGSRLVPGHGKMSGDCGRPCYEIRKGDVPVISRGITASNRSTSINLKTILNFCPLVLCMIAFMIADAVKHSDPRLATSILLPHLRFSAAQVIDAYWCWQLVDGLMDSTFSFAKSHPMPMPQCSACGQFVNLESWLEGKEPCEYWVIFNLNIRTPSICGLLKQCQADCFKRKRAMGRRDDCHSCDPWGHFFSQSESKILVEPGDIVPWPAKCELPRPSQETPVKLARARPDFQTLY